MLVRTVRALVAATAGVAMVAWGGVAAQAAPARPDGLTVVAVRHSLLATHTWYQQTYRGLPVLDGFYVTHVDRKSGRLTVDDGRLAVGGAPSTSATFPQGRAHINALGKAGGTSAGERLVIVAGAHATLAWEVLSVRDNGSARVLVDARTGVVLRVQQLAKEANGSGTVFEPNPVVALQNESLVDNKNKDSATFTPAYKTVTLTQLDSTGKLTGLYANNVSSSAVTSSTHTYNFNRSQAGFEQVMGYYNITKAQEWIHTLGFTDVNNEAQKYRTTGLSADNSFYDPATDRITYGTGGVDDAEDSEVIWHEYGHAIQDAQIPGFGSTEEAGAIGEGFGDYWAFSMSTVDSPNTATTPWACLADWDSTSYTTGTPHCLRRVDGTKTYPGSLDGEVHDDGEIWSRALYDIWNALGRVESDTAILEGQFSFTANTTMPAAASHIVAAAQALYGTAAANACTAAFHARGIL